MSGVSTYPQIPEASAGRVGAPRLPRLRRTRADRFFVANEIVEASSHARRAQILLRLPDAIVLEKTEALMGACRRAGFMPGVQFIGQRIAALCANRLPDGQLPAAHRDTLALWTNGLAALAAGEQ